MVKIEVNKADLAKVLAAIEAVKQVVLSQALTIPEDSAREFSAQIRENVVSQKYGSFGQNRSSDWKKYYPETAGMFWKWLGTALHSLQATRSPRSTATKISWRVGFGAYAAGVRSVATKVKKVAGPQVTVGVKIDKTGKRTLIKRGLTPAELRSRERRIADLQFERKIRSNVDKQVKHYGPDSELVKQYNAERGLGPKVYSRSIKRDVNLGKPHETPAEDRAERIRIKRKIMLGKTNDRE